MSAALGLVVPGLALVPTTMTVSVAAPSPTPTQGELDPNDVSPGLLGFAVVFAIVLLCIPLFRSMSGKIRRIEHGAEVADAAAAAEAPDDQDPRAGTDPAAGTP